MCIAPIKGRCQVLEWENSSSDVSSIFDMLAQAWPTDHAFEQQESVWDDVRLISSVIMAVDAANIQTSSHGDGVSLSNLNVTNGDVGVAHYRPHDAQSSN